MTSLIEYIEESLLDDLGDLEVSSDTNVEKLQTIGNDYKIDSITDTRGDLFDLLNKSVLKKSKNIWDRRDFWMIKPHKVYTHSGRMLKPHKICVQLANAILSLDKDCLQEGKLDNNNDMYKLFYTLFEKWIKTDGVKLTICIEDYLNKMIIRVSCITSDYQDGIKYTKEFREFVISLIPKQ
jgi:hypothetical protein